MREGRGGGRQVAHGEGPQRSRRGSGGGRGVSWDATGPTPCRGDGRQEDAGGDGDTVGVGRSATAVETSGERGAAGCDGAHNHNQLWGARDIRSVWHAVRDEQPPRARPHTCRAGSTGGATCARATAEAFVLGHRNRRRGEVARIPRPCTRNRRVRVRVAQHVVVEQVCGRREGREGERWRESDASHAAAPSPPTNRLAEATMSSSRSVYRVSLFFSMKPPTQ
jgi:hypothetical protein